MGQKSNPIGLRLKIINDWQSIWYTNNSKEYAAKIKEDVLLRRYIYKAFYRAAVSKIVIQRKVDLVTVNIYSAKPGIIIGKKGVDIDKVKNQLTKMKMVQGSIELNVLEVKKPDLDSVLISKNIAQQLEKRISFRRAMKKVIQAALRAGAKGIKVSCSGRLGGAEIARTEWYKEGRIPLHTLRAKISYGVAEASTVYGKIGVKVWVYIGDVVSFEEQE